MVDIDVFEIKAYIDSLENDELAQSNRVPIVQTRCRKYINQIIDYIRAVEANMPSELSRKEKTMYIDLDDITMIAYECCMFNQIDVKKGRVNPIAHIESRINLEYEDYNKNNIPPTTMINGLSSELFQKECDKYDQDVLLRECEDHIIRTMYSLYLCNNPPKAGKLRLRAFSDDTGFFDEPSFFGINVQFERDGLPKQVISNTKSYFNTCSQIHLGLFQIHAERLLDQKGIPNPKDLIEKQLDTIESTLKAVGPYSTKLGIENGNLFNFNSD